MIERLRSRCMLAGVDERDCRVDRLRRGADCILGHAACCDNDRYVRQIPAPRPSPRTPQAEGTECPH